eukprot:UN10336
MAGRTRRRVNYKEDGGFRPKRGEDSDFGGSDLELDDDQSGILRGLLEFRWGLWEEVQKILNPAEQKAFDTPELIEISSVQLVAYIFTGGRNRINHKNSSAIPWQVILYRIQVFWQVLTLN